jgi:hypothetical protein
MLYKLPSAEEAAIILASFLLRYGKESGKEVTRLYLANSTFRVLVDRSTVRLAFLGDLSDALLEFGICFIVTSGGFGLIVEDSVQSWTRVRSKLVKDWLDERKNGNLDYSRLFNDYIKPTLRQEEAKD